MSFFSKLAFWKKEENPLDFDSSSSNPFDSNFADQTALNNSDPFSFQQNTNQQTIGKNPFTQPFESSPSSFSMQQQYISSAQQYSQNKDFEIVSAKLDALKANLDSINQRLMNVEQMLKDQQERNSRVRW